MNLLPAPKPKDKLTGKLMKLFQLKNLTFFKIPTKKRYLLASILDICLILLIVMNGIKPAERIINPLISPLQPLQPLNSKNKSSYEVFGFAPFWTIDRLDNVDFKTLTTFSYFGVPVLADGSLDKDDRGYQVFKSDKATKLFKKAHDHNTRVVLTITQMKNPTIKALLDDPAAQERAIAQTVQEVKNRGIDGINVDFEYTGNPGSDYRNKFSQFVQNITERMHQEIPSSRVTVSVYASAAKTPKMYDISQIGKSADGIFMMAYDFAVAGSDNAIPTAPLYGHQDGTYWYDISTAVADFSKQMDPRKLILGVPYYGYNYLVYEPTVKAETRPNYTWRGKAAAQTYSIVQNEITPEKEGITEFKTGWDDKGQVGWKAYHVEATDTWRMVFQDDVKSLGIKYDFAKEKNLAGVGMWALGFDNGKEELWSLLREKFSQAELAKANF